MILDRLKIRNGFRCREGQLEAEICVSAIPRVFDKLYNEERQLLIRIKVQTQLLDTIWLEKQSVKIIKSSIGLEARQRSITLSSDYIGSFDMLDKVIMACIGGLMVDV
ncbi:uncharacterized protein [Gossypium hirsutum]|uniref:Uncharacterized protein n=1 Tax=Gossypium hirsutum TaxID=3635 RepID=A0ABM2ZRR7_GOSHI|nr:uncharacterized protein LOC121214878 [Gossypium hirsutum]